jgi:protein gp37
MWGSTRAAPAVFKKWRRFKKPNGRETAGRCFDMIASILLVAYW